MKSRPAIRVYCPDPAGVAHREPQGAQATDDDERVARLAEAVEGECGKLVNSAARRYRCDLVAGLFSKLEIAVGTEGDL